MGRKTASGYTALPHPSLSDTHPDSGIDPFLPLTWAKRNQSTFRTDAIYGHDALVELKPVLQTTAWEPPDYDLALGTRPLIVAAITRYGSGLPRTSAAREILISTPRPWSAPSCSCSRLLSRWKMASRMGPLSYSSAVP
jgi:hypothetical protein